MKHRLVTAGLVILGLSLSANAAEPSSTIYKLEFADRTTFLKASISLHANLQKSQPQTQTLWATLSKAELARVSPFVVSIEAVMDEAAFLPHQQIDLALSGIPGYSCYPTVEETQAELISLVSTYPQLATQIDIGDSWRKQAGKGGYDLTVLKLTNQQIEGDKPKLFIHAAMHAREYATSPLALAFAQELLQNYANDADIQWILDRHEIHLLLHMNPDGRKQAEAGLLWRKNANEDYCGENASAQGADLNRNFSWEWGTVAGGSSGEECSDIYRGPSAASEPETQAVEAYVRQIFGDHRGPNRTDAAAETTQGLHIDVHSFSELVLWPWGDTQDTAPNAAALQALGRKLAHFNGYTPMQSVGLYPTDGTSDSVTYGELGIPHMTFEVGTTFFQSCSDFHATILPDNLNAFKYAAKIVDAPYLTPSGPDISQMLLNGKSVFQVANDKAAVLSVSASDARFSARAGTELTQAISDIVLYVDASPWDSQVTPISLVAKDGSFDSVTEQAEYQLDVSSVSLGRHTLYMKARDSSGQWGAVSSVF